MFGTFKHVDPYRPAPPPPPPPPPVMVYAREPDGKLSVFEAAPPIAAAIAQVRAAGYQRALVLAWSKP